MEDMNHGIRILLVDYLLKRITGENTYLSSQEIVDILSRLNIQVGNNTIRSDIKSIIQFNQIIENYHQELLENNSFHISGAIQLETIRKKGTLVKKAIFNISELIILFKFIENSFYLNQEEKQLIMEKILIHSSFDIINTYHLNNGFDDSTHYNEGKESLIAVTTIQKAISQDKCLKFKYYTYDSKDKSFQRVLLNKEYYIYPIRFVMEGNYLYVVGYDLSECHSYKKNDSYLKVKNYRIDRMTCMHTTEKINVIEEFLTAAIVQEDKNKVDNHINGFGGENTITLKIKIYKNGDIEKTPFKAFVDKFGKKIINVEKYESYIIVTIDDILEGIGLIHYLFSFDKQIEVLEPLSLRNQMITIIKDMYRNYSIV